MCPFCGGEPTIDSAYTDNPAALVIVSCENINCPAIARVNGIAAEVEKKWNTRAEEPAEEKTAHWGINCDGYYPYCSNCKEEPQGGKLSPYCPNCGAEMVTRGR